LVAYGDLPPSHADALETAVTCDDIPYPQT
jgi:hypothetical protein